MKLSVVVNIVLRQVFEWKQNYSYPKGHFQSPQEAKTFVSTTATICGNKLPIISPHQARYTDVKREITGFITSYL